MADFLKPEEREIAATRLRSRAARLINKVVRFHNALKTMLGDISPSPAGKPVKTIFAIDATEIYAHIFYDKAVFTAASFGGLLANDDREKQDLEIIDRLIVNYLLFDQKRKFLLADSHAEEILMVHEAVRREYVNLRDDLLHSVDMEKFDGFTPENIKNIENYICHLDKKEVPEEWEIFQNTFLPNWRKELFRSYINAKTKADGLKFFMKKGKYVFLRGQEAGERALTNLIDFDWQKFHSHANSKEQRKLRAQIARDIADLLSHIPRHKNRKLREAADIRDGLAFADLHVLNTFLEQEGISAKVDMISRSPSLHNIMSVLPPGKLNMTLRHPLLVPELYSFSQEALETIASIMQQVEGALSALLDMDLGEAGFANKDIIGNENEKEILDHVRTIVSKVLPILRDSITIQHGVELDEESFKKIYASIMDGEKVENFERTVSEIRHTFSLIIDKMEKSDDPITRAAFEEIIDHNVSLAKMEVERSFSNERELEVISYKIPSRTPISPEDFYVVRPLSGNFTRVFCLYSEEIMDGIKNGERDITLKRPEYVTFTIDGLVKRLDDVGKKPEKDLVDGLDATLLVASAFASKRKYTTALSLVSALLHFITTKLRISNKAHESCRNFSVRTLLSFRELLLFRHFCERAIGFQEFFRAEKSFDYHKGVVEKSYARAQRDLDFAVYLSEIIEGRCLESPSPSGEMALKDYRHRLAAMSSWMDMYLMSLHSGDDEWCDFFGERKHISAIKLRKDILVATSMAKKAYISSFKIKNIVKSLDGNMENAKRYYTYLEARFLQNALLIFIMLVSNRNIPLYKKIWGRHDGDIRRDDILAFHEWNKWWRRFRDILNEYDFDFRLEETIHAICEFIDSSPGNRQISDLIGRLENINNKHKEEDPRAKYGFSCKLRDMVIDSLKDF